MSPETTRITLRAAAALLLLAGAAGAGSTMKLLAAEAPIPQDTQPVALSGLAYTTRAWRGSVESVQLREVPAPDAKKAAWVVRASNSRGSRLRIDVDLHLLDAEGKRLASGKKTMLLGANALDAREEVEIKLASGVWAKAKSLRIEVRFMS